MAKKIKVTKGNLYLDNCGYAIYIKATKLKGNTTLYVDQCGDLRNPNGSHYRSDYAFPAVRKIPKSDFVVYQATGGVDVMYYYEGKLYVGEIARHKKNVRPYLEDFCNAAGITFTGKASHKDRLWGYSYFLDRNHIDLRCDYTRQKQAKFLKIGCLSFAIKDLERIIKFMAPYVGYEMEG